MRLNFRCNFNLKINLTSASRRNQTIMAAVTHATPPPYLSLSISQNGTDSTINGLHLSQPAANSFEATQLANSTQTATSPASRGHQHIMPLNMASYGPANGHHLQSAPPRGLADTTGHVAHQIYPANHKPQIYTVCLPNYRDYFNANPIPSSRLYILASQCTRWRSANLWSCADEMIRG